MNSFNKIALMGLLLTSTFVSCKKSSNDFFATGTFETTEVIVSSEATGKILSLNVEEGQVLKQGELVGAIDSVQLYLKKQQLLTSSKAIQNRRPDVKKQIAALEQQIATAKTERKRIENLLKANAANHKQLDDVNAQILVLEKQLDAQKTTLITSNDAITDETKGVAIQVEQVQDQLRKCYIISPIGGTVLVKYSEKGEVAMPGKAIFKIADTNEMILRAYLTADQLTQVKIGQQLKVFADFGKDQTREYSGVISWISNKSEFTPKTIQTRDERANLVYAVKIKVKNDGYLKIGMYGSVDLK
jgi:HlyD family secretion protein